MKRIFVLLLAVIFAVISFSASAESGLFYDLEDLHIQVILPADMIAFTRNIDEDIVDSEIFGMDRDDMLAMHKQNCIYLDSVDEERTLNIVITMVETGSSITDFSILDEDELDLLADTYEEYFGEYNLHVESSEIYVHSQTNFVKMYTFHEYDDFTDYMIQYTTIFAGNTINITIHSLDGEIDTGDENLIRKVVDNIRFAPEFFEKPETLTNVEPFIYEDTEYPISFCVPANWTQVELSKEREIIKAKFEPIEKTGDCISYGCSDLYAEMKSDSDLSLQMTVIDLIYGFSRENYDDTFFLAYYPSFYLDFFGEQGFDAADITKVEYGDHTYHLVTITQEQTYDGITFPVTLTNCVTIVDGYLYEFFFSGTNDNPYYRDFESLLESVQFN